MTVSDDSLAILLLNMNLFPSKSRTTDFKAFTLFQWNKLAQQIKDSSYTGPADLFGKTIENLMNDLYLDRQTSSRIVNLLGHANFMTEELKRLKKLGIGVVTRADKEYPLLMKSKLRDQAPSYMFFAGDLTNLNRTAIGVVGSRNADDYCLNLTKKLVSKAVDEGLAVVSGGAKGVDITAQDQAIAHGGIAISILHSDLEGWSKKKEIQRNIHSGNLTLLTAVHPKARFQGFNAMGRNKYIYSHSKATFVMASSTSGGTWEGALENIKNNWVPLFIQLDNEVPEGNKILFEKYKNNPMVSSINLNENISIVEKIREVLKINNQNSETKNDRDIFPLILPVLKQVLSEDKTNIQISKELNVNIDQINFWVERYHSLDSNMNSSPNTNNVIQGKLF
ncbi:Predicted Rossmann fold nucleotide-binding protein DprA/Smf involved in DNA uptake [Paenibacillus sp. cl141a]|uniref:DNA-processing protein DprA n=1 Tax=Paenibacillus sp. cl141a TaxID=1761877 RepID=UPI0008AFDDE3|nr:DNA-processing protein DprA [Paenibacillus sp. cl141a]SEK18998.1 Predicted Rossmann fold nucleotide-binding protein DprA/Smf involved in DNA uptake [Paenibacillus sp. cl141a]